MYNFYWIQHDPEPILSGRENPKFDIDKTFKKFTTKITEEVNDISSDRYLKSKIGNFRRYGTKK